MPMRITIVVCVCVFGHPPFHEQQQTLQTTTLGWAVTLDSPTSPVLGFAASSISLSESFLTEGSNSLGPPT